MVTKDKKMGVVFCGGKKIGWQQKNLTRLSNKKEERRGRPHFGEDPPREIVGGL